ncbi:hypothetical protein GCM10027262_40520 [Nocardia tengchongensis]
MLCKIVCAAVLFAAAAGAGTGIASAAYDGEVYPSYAACAADARAQEAATRNTTADTATCDQVPGNSGRGLWQITITPRPWLNQRSDDTTDPSDFAGGFMRGLTSGSAQR